MKNKSILNDSRVTDNSWCFQTGLLFFQEMWILRVANGARLIALSIKYEQDLLLKTTGRLMAYL